VARCLGTAVTLLSVEGNVSKYTEETDSKHRTDSEDDVPS